MMVGVTSIDQVETSSICDKACEYCPARLQSAHRPVGMMTMETFDKVMKWVDYCVRNRTQTQFNMYGVGEALLNPHIVDMVRIARSHIPYAIPIHLNTNGKSLTEGLARDLRDAGITSVDVTGHNAREATEAIILLRKYKIFGNLTVDFMLNPNNWAGQVDWPNPKVEGVEYPCPWLFVGRVFVMWDGRVSQCALDAFGQGIIGNLDDNPADVKLARFSLCDKCHSSLPYGMVPDFERIRNR